VAAEPNAVPPSSSPTSVGVAACLATTLIWSGNTIVTKAAAGVIAPGSIAFYRWLLAFLILAPIVGPAAWRNRAVAFRCWKQLAALGALGMVIYQSLAYKAAETTSAVNMGVIQALMPLFAAFLASALAAERLSALRVLGGILSLGGLAYLTSRGDPAGLIRGGLHLGDALMLVAVFANALYGVMVRRWAIPLPPWQQLFWQILFSTLMLIPVWLAGTVSPITAANLPLILYAAIPTSLVAPWCWIIGIQRLGSGRTALFINLLPVVVALLAWLLLHEELHGYHLIGGIVALVGVGLGLREPKAPSDRRSSTAGSSAWKTEEL
jgi:drug/metabolite transporter (DMT)-like permease